MTTTVIAGDQEQERRARRFARDGLLFLGLAFASTAVCVALNFLAPRESQELLTGFGVGGASALVFAGMGLMKLTQARRAGLKAAGLGAAGLASAFYLTLLFVAICGYVLPRLLERQLGRYTGVVSWSIPLLTCLVPLILKMRRAAASSLQRSGCAVAASFLCWIYIDGLIGYQNWRWLLFGARAMEDYHYGLWSESQQELIPALAIAGVLGLIFLALAAFAFRNEIRSHGITPAVARLRTWARCSAALLLVTCAGMFCKHIATYWAVVAVLLFGGGAVRLGSMLARLKQPAPVSLRRRMMFTAPLLLLTLPLVLSAGIAGSASSAREYLYRAPYQYNSVCDWSWYVPEPVRAPLARFIGRCSDELNAGVYLNGLVATPDLKSEALKPGRVSKYIGDGAWLAWCARDPQAALSAAHAVAPPPANSNFLSTTYDTGAGLAIGQLGSDDDIRRHLTGGYSAEFTFGVLTGLTPERRTRMSGEIVDYFKSQRYARGALSWLSWEMPSVFHKLAIESIDAPSPKNLGLIRDLLGVARGDLVAYALNSRDKTVRRLAMRAVGVRFSAINDEFLQSLIKSMQGTLPNSDFDEKRAAAVLVSKRFRPAFIGLRATNAPLSAQEQTQVDALIKKAQEWLTQHENRP